MTGFWRRALVARLTARPVAVLCCVVKDAAAIAPPPAGDAVVTVLPDAEHAGGAVAPAPKPSFLSRMWGRGSQSPVDAPATSGTPSAPDVVIAVGADRAVPGSAPTPGVGVGVGLGSPSLAATSPVMPTVPNGTGTNTGGAAAPASGGSAVVVAGKGKGKGPPPVVYVRADPDAPEYLEGRKVAGFIPGIACRASRRAMPWSCASLFMPWMACVGRCLPLSWSQTCSSLRSKRTSCTAGSSLGTASSCAAPSSPWAS